MEITYKNRLVKSILESYPSLKGNTNINTNSFIQIKDEDYISLAELYNSIDINSIKRLKFLKKIEYNIQDIDYEIANSINYNLSTNKILSITDSNNLNEIFNFIDLESRKAIFNNYSVFNRVLDKSLESYEGFESDIFDLTRIYNNFYFYKNSTTTTNNLFGTLFKVKNNNINIIYTLTVNKKYINYFLYCIAFNITPINSIFKFIVDKELYNLYVPKSFKELKDSDEFDSMIYYTNDIFNKYYLVNEFKLNDSPISPSSFKDFEDKKLEFIDKLFLNINNTENENSNPYFNSGSVSERYSYFENKEKSVLSEIESRKAPEEILF